MVMTPGSVAPWALFVVAGALVGALTGFFGVGGSSIAMPALSLSRPAAGHLPRPARHDPLLDRGRHPLARLGQDSPPQGGSVVPSPAGCRQLSPVPCCPRWSAAQRSRGLWRRRDGRRAAGDPSGYVRLTRCRHGAAPESSTAGGGLGQRRPLPVYWPTAAASCSCRYSHLVRLGHARGSGHQPVGDQRAHIADQWLRTGRSATSTGPWLEPSPWGGSGQRVSGHTRPERQQETPHARRSAGS